MGRFRFSCMSLAAVILAGCAVGPDYVPPAVETPPAFKESNGVWEPSLPQDDLDRGDWWAVYQDPVLDTLEKQVDISNQNLKAAEAAYRQAKAIVDQTYSSLFPVLTIGTGVTATGTLGSQSRNNSISQTSITSSNPTSSTAVATGGGAKTSTVFQYNASADVSWTLDVWGSIRRTIEANEATAEADAADIASARLSAQATLATTYFQLRVQDDLKRLLDQTVTNDQQILKIVQNQLQVGVAAQVDVLTAQTQLESVQASLVNADVARSQYEHAIAVLIGKPPSEFSLAPAPYTFAIPNIPAEIPSTVLQRRPDIAAAERQVDAANAQIGVAVAAYYPDLTISGSFQSIATQLGQLLKASNMVWSVGPSLAETVIDFGARDAVVDQAHAAYDQTVANYRQTVLSAFENVEDNLAAERILAQQARIENQTVADARTSERLTLNQYKQGIIPYNTVLVAQSTTLSNEETALNVELSRVTTSVSLIEGLGGGWNVTKLKQTPVFVSEPPIMNPVSTPTPETPAAATVVSPTEPLTASPTTTPESEQASSTPPAAPSNVKTMPPPSTTTTDIQMP